MRDGTIWFVGGSGRGGEARLMFHTREGLGTTTTTTTTTRLEEQRHERK